MNTIFKQLFFLQILLLFSALVLAGEKLHYQKEEIMVPMRDGTRLFTRIYMPVGLKDSLPVLIMRSPYPDWNMGLIYPDNDPFVSNMAAEGYIFVYQNIRGKQKSEGTFIMEPPFNKFDDTSINESTDTYDLIEYLINHLPTNKRVGILGISYPGEMALLASIKPHPALKAASPQATVGDFFLSDDYFHNGAFRLSFSFEYSYSEQSGRDERAFPFTKYDLYQWYLDLGPLPNVNNVYFHNKIPAWDEFISHPNYDDFWHDKAPVNYSDTPKIPILHVGGYWDQENAAGPQMLFEKMERFDRDNKNFLVLGPWKHGQWADTNASIIGPYEMERNTASDFKAIQKKWFDYWLKGIGELEMSNATCFQTGSNKWKNYNAWPPALKEKKLYLQNKKGLDFENKSPQATDTYLSDPESPVMYRSRPIEMTYSDSSCWEDWMTEDQREVDHRPDVLSYSTSVLTSDVTITGKIIAHLFAATSGTDADWVVKLIDVYPDICKEKPDLSETQLIIAAEIFRGRFLKSFNKPQPLISGKPEEYVFSLHEANHVFKKGHKIMVQIQSTWFPLYDRNPQKFVPNIFLATEEDYQKATQTIYHNGRLASYISLPVDE